jgi:hypothetical protein
MQRNEKYYLPFNLGKRGVVQVTNKQHFQELSEAVDLSQRAVYSDVTIPSLSDTMKAGANIALDVRISDHTQQIRCPRTKDCKNSTFWPSVTSTWNITTETIASTFVT